MKWQTSSLAIALRYWARKFGVTRELQRLLSFGRYEAKFQSALLSAIRPGDCVWDVGANVGMYSLLFADRVGSSGRVYAFEPSPTNFRALEAAVSENRLCHPVQLALGASEGIVAFHQGHDEIGATSRVLDRSDLDERQQLRVDMSTADAVVASGCAPLANVMKIDTEGFELEVLRGMRGLLTNHELRTVCIEVHFGILAERGQPHAPRQIEQLLVEAGLRVRWVDASHLIASRN